MNVRNRPKNSDAYGLIPPLVNVATLDMKTEQKTNLQVLLTRVRYSRVIRRLIFPGMQLQKLSNSDKLIIVYTKTIIQTSFSYTSCPLRVESSVYPTVLSIARK